MSMDLTQMTLVELHQLKARVDKAIVRAEGRKKKDALAAMEKAASEFGLSISEVLGGAEAAPKKKRGPKPGTKRKAAPKKGKAQFANPADASQTWTGKGRQPAWYKDAIAGGASPDSMKV